MTLPGQAAHGLHGDDWQARRIRELESLVRALTTAPTLQAASVAAGAFTVQPGGTFQLEAASGIVVFLAGEAVGADRPDGTPQAVVLMTRDTGEPAFYLGDTDPADGYQQAWQWYDRAGNIVFAEDTTAGAGLARPYLPIGQWVDYSTAPSIKTSSTTWTTLELCNGYRHHPQVVATILVGTDAGTTGDVRIVTGNGQQIGDIHSTAAGVTEVATIGPVVAPIDNADAYPEPTAYQLQARVTSGAGMIGVRGLSIAGIQS